MSEFKVGDSVRLKEGLKINQRYGRLTFIDGMQFVGSLPINDITDAGNHIIIHPFWGELRYTSEMLELGSLSLSEIIERNYAATVKRGKITPETTIQDFLYKIHEEYKELEESYYNNVVKDIFDFDAKELADIVLVCFAKAKHFNIDLLKVMEEKTLYNETRTD